MKHHTVVEGEALSEARRIDAVRSMIRVLDTVGGPDALARLLGETNHRVIHWREIPVRHVFAVEAATGIAHTELRPDVDFTKPHSADWYPCDGWVPEGVDVTDQVGSQHAVTDWASAADAAFSRLQTAWHKALDEPGMRNFRACAAAFDEFERVMQQS